MATYVIATISKWGLTMTSTSAFNWRTGNFPTMILAGARGLPSGCRYGRFSSPPDYRPPPPDTGRTCSDLTKRKQSRLSCLPPW
jgi:hypothetical protein